MAASHVCPVCGYGYDPKDHNNVAFEYFPNDLICPVCGAEKVQFEKM